MFPATSSPTPNLDIVFTALADPTRRDILRRVSAGEMRVTEIAKPFEMSLNAVSKHIRVLERAGLVRRRRAGREHFLTFTPEPLGDAAAWVEEMRSFWNTRLDALARHLEESAAPAPAERQHHEQQ